MVNEVELVMDFIKKHINQAIIFTGNIENTIQWQYPLEALREIVLNMIIHRDYSQSADSVIKIFDDRIEFYNPGSLPHGITIDKLLANDYISTPRNKLIANLFKEMGWIEKYGSGIQRIIESFKTARLPNPMFEEIGTGIRVTVFGEEISDNVTDNVVDNVVDNEIKILNLLQTKPYLSATALAELTGLSSRSVQRYLKSLKEKDRIIRKGSDKGGYWQINEHSTN